MKIFSERLKRLRTEKEISQAKLALLLGVTQQAVDRWEQDKTEPNMETIVQLSIFFDVTTDYLLGLNNDISKSSTIKNSFNYNNGKINFKG